MVDDEPLRDFLRLDQQTFVGKGCPPDNQPCNRQNLHTSITGRHSAPAFSAFLWIYSTCSGKSRLQRVKIPGIYLFGRNYTFISTLYCLHSFLLATHSFCLLLALALADDLDFTDITASDEPSAEVSEVRNGDWA